MNEVEILIISNSKDFTSDYICLELNGRQCTYLRINRDLFATYSVHFDIDNLRLLITIDDLEYLVTNGSLRSIYYRAPIYLHYVPQTPQSFEDQLYRTQWMSFLRNLTIFDNVKWMNNPVSTFRSENKMLQLKYAKLCGFSCPKTLLANKISPSDIIGNQKYAVKSLDTVILREGTDEAFSYTNILTGEEILRSELSLSPVVVQEYISPKIDLRVTVVHDQLLAVKILHDNMGIEGDWRRSREVAKFVKTDLPGDIARSCIEITQTLGIEFGGIDLAFCNGIYYFIEINPTGEWAWLIKNAGCQIDKMICDFLCC